MDELERHRGLDGIVTPAEAAALSGWIPARLQTRQTIRINA